MPPSTPRDSRRRSTGHVDPSAASDMPSSATGTLQEASQGLARVVYRPLSSLTKLPNNPRRLADAQFHDLCASLKANPGFFDARPIILSDRTGELIIIAGNMKAEAAKANGLTDVPTVLLSGMTEAQEREIIIRDNAHAGEWDFDALANNWSDLPLAEWGVPLPDEWLSEPQPPQDAEPQIDRAEELRAQWQTERGQLWQIGKHRLLCGDSTSRDDVERLMGGEKAALCFTDPPYGADIKYATHNDTQDALEGLIAGFFPIARKLSEVVALTPGINNVFLYPKPSWLLCWFYASGTGRSPWGFTAWQPVAVWGDDPKLSAGEGCHPDGFQWMMDKDDAAINKSLGHACPKPTSVWTRFLERLTNKKSRLIYDPFLGSGTTMVSSENLKLECRALEIAPEYVAVNLQRMSDAFPGIAITRLEP